MKILKRIWRALFPSTEKSSSPDTSTEETSSSEVVEFLKSKGLINEEHDKFKIFRDIMEVQVELRRVFNTDAPGRVNNKIEGMELDYRILSNLIHFDLIGVQAMDNKKGDAYYLAYDDKDHPQSLQVMTEDLKAVSREMKAGFTTEADADVMNLHGIDLAEEIRLAVAMEIVEEKNAELMKAIRENCHISKYKFKDTAKGSTRMELMILLHKMRNSIVKESRRGLGSYFIVPSRVLAVMHSFVTSTADFEFMPSYQLQAPGAWNPSIQLAGWFLLGGKEQIPVYHDTISDGDWILSGYKGESQIDVGAVYAPYVLATFDYQMDEKPAEIEGQMPLINEVFVGRTRGDFFGPRKDYFHMVELDMTEIDKFFEELKKEAA